jgi:hypothetical protein
MDLLGVASDGEAIPLFKWCGGSLSTQESLQKVRRIWWVRASLVAVSQIILKRRRIESLGRVLLVACLGHVVSQSRPQTLPLNMKT